jgi:hypothetical protein
VKHYIYGLYDPRDNQIRYVGRTINMKHRYKQHRRPSNSTEGKKKVNWVLELKAQSLEPVMKMLEEVDETNVAERERYHIKYYLSLGANLTNSVLIGPSLKPYHPILPKLKIIPDRKVPVAQKANLAIELEIKELYALHIQQTRIIGELTEREKAMISLGQEAEILRQEVSGLRKRVERLIQYRVLFWVMLVLFVVAVVIFSVLLYVNLP